MSGNAYSPGPSLRTVVSQSGQVLQVPADWELLAPGDAGLTRRVKAAGEHWVVQEKKGRRVFSKGVWAAASTIERIRAELESERATETYARRRAADTMRREKIQDEYVEDFSSAVLGFLGFHKKYEQMAKQLAGEVTRHATPVGSGTVARTKRIPVEQRAEAAVIAWMRHQTTAYDSMKIARVRGKRREVRRMLAARSKELLHRYRNAEAESIDCPLRIALSRITLENVKKQETDQE